MMVKSKFINNLKDIEQLKNINELDIDIIENRAEPIQDNTSDKESWRYRSFDGFLGTDETLKSRLIKDWILLDKYNKENNTEITHLYLSNKLKDILNQCEQIRKDNGFGPMTPIKLKFENQIDLYICKNIFNGFQYSLFWNDSINNNNNNDNNNNNNNNTTNIWNQKWNVDYTIKNLKTNDEIIVSGDSLNGIIKYIEYIGFYEGDENNPYRIDPIKLINILSSK